MSALHKIECMVVTQESLLRKIEEFAGLEKGKPIDITLLAKHFKCPFADILVLLYEMEKWKIVKLNLENGIDKPKGKKEVILLS